MRRLGAGLRPFDQEMPEPRSGEAGDGLQRPGLLEQVRRAGDDLEVLLAPEPGVSLPVQLDDLAILAPDDEQGGRRDAGERVGGPWKNRDENES